MNQQKTVMNDEQTISDLRDENEQLRIALSDLLGNVNEDVPADIMSKHFLAAIANAEDLLADLGDIDHEENAE